LHRFGKPYRNDGGDIERRCLNKGDDRTHLQAYRGRCRTTLSHRRIHHCYPPTDQDRS
jgi:hypothetical protein